MRGELQLLHNRGVGCEEVVFVGHLPGAGSAVGVHYLPPEQHSSAVFLGEVLAVLDLSSSVTDKGKHANMVVSKNEGLFLQLKWLIICSSLSCFHYNV